MTYPATLRFPATARGVGAPFDWQLTPDGGFVAEYESREFLLLCMACAMTKEEWEAISVGANDQND